MSSKRTSQTLRSFVESTIKATKPRTKNAAARAEHRRAVVAAAVAAAEKGSIRREDGARYNVEGVYTKTYTLYNELTSN